MISFRFHLVSLVAVFLALALGIGMGVTVIDRVGVDRLQGRLDQVRAEVSAANDRSDKLQREQERAKDYEARSSEYMIDARLADVPVTIVAVRGVDGASVDQLEQSVTDAGGRLQGTLWFTGRATLDDANTIGQMQQVLGVPAGDNMALRSGLIARVSAVMTGAAPPSTLTPVIATGVLEWEGASGNNTIEQAAPAEGRVVVVSGADADVGSDVLAVPLVKTLAAQPVKRLVAAEVDLPEADGQDESASVFAKPLRDDRSLDGELSTVDHLDRVSGRVATVLALSQLPTRTGDYGVNAGASSSLPELNP